MDSGDGVRSRAAMPGRRRSALIITLSVVALIGAVLPWLGIAQAWQITDAEAGMFPEPPGDVTRLLVVADAVSFGVFNSSAGIPPLAIGAAVAVLVITSGSGASEVLGGRQRAVRLEEVGVVLLAAALGALAALTRVLLVGYAWTSIPPEYVGIFFSPSSGVDDAIGLLVPAAEMLGWTVVLLLGAARWTRSDAASVVHDLDEEDLEQEDPPRRDSPVEEDSAGRPPRAGPHTRVEPARLRPDGSSDSGFDEFHFRR